MFGFEAHIASNKLKTFLLVLCFIAIMGLLGYMGGYFFAEEFSYILLVACV
ncbi:hypothetical protein IIA79_05070, partial [bacterium]|nr:hypothetical protein [bacterium]